MSKYQAVKEKLAKNIENKPGLPNIEYARPFIDAGFNERTVLRWVKTVKEGGNLERKIGSGRPKKIGTAGNIQKIKKMFNHRSFYSLFFDI